MTWVSLNLAIMDLESFDLIKFTFSIKSIYLMPSQRQEKLQWNIFQVCFHDEVSHIQQVPGAIGGLFRNIVFGRCFWQN